MEKIKETFDLVVQFVAENQWVIYLAISIIVPLIVFIIVRKNKKNKLIEQLEQAQSKINSIKSYPFLHNLNKADALAKINKDIFDIVTQCRADYTLIQDQLKEIQSLIIDSDEFLSVNKLAACKENNDVVLNKVNETENIANQLNDKLLEILQQETNQRNEITDLKETYRELRKKANTNAQIYAFSWTELDRMNQHISDLFTDFESVMMGLKYDEATKKKEQIKIELDVFNEILESVPDLIVVAKNDIPQMIKLTKKEYEELKNANVYLDNIFVDDVIERTNQVLDECLDKIKKCQLTGVNDQLLNCENEMNHLYSQLMEEKNAHNDLVNAQQKAEETVAHLEKVVLSVSESVSTADERYGLEEYKKTIESYQSQTKKIKKEYEKISKTVSSLQIPASTIVMGLRDIIARAESIIEEAQGSLKEVTGAKYDESKARQHISEWSYALNEIKALMRLNRLPNVNSKFQEDVDKSFSYIKEIDDILNGASVNISALNVKIAEANRFISTVCSSAINNTIANANKAESLIVMANNYRSSYPAVDEEASKCEAIFRQGNYSQVIASLSNVLRKIDAQAVSDIVKG